MSARPPVSPPRSGAALLSRLLPPEDREIVLGDLAEEHASRRLHGAARATLWYWRQVLEFVLRLGLERLRRRRHPRARARAREGLMTGCWLDLRMAARTLTRSPGFALAAVATLAVGIGANVALLSVADAAFLRPLPLPQSDRLLNVYSANGSSLYRSSNYADFVDLEERTADVFTGVSAFVGWEVSALLDGEAELLEAELVSARHFRVLGLRPAVGRFFSPAGVGGSREVVLSYRLWRRAFGGAPEVVGRTIELSGSSFTVIGVTPRGFRGLDLSRSPALWTTLDHYDLLATGFWSWFEATDYEEQRTPRRRVSMWSIVGRLADDVDAEHAAAAVDLVGRQLAQEFPDSNGELSLIVEPTVRAATPLGERDRAVRFVSLLLGATGLASLLGCANLAHLMLGRGSQRRGEIALRHALGARRSRLVRQLLTESLVLGVLGGAAGIGVAWAAIRGLGRFDLPGDVDISALVDGLEPSVLLPTAGLVLVTTALFGVLPAWRSSRRDPGHALGSGQRAPGRAVAARWGLVTTQVALSSVLLLGAGLFLRSLHHALSADLGFDVGSKLLATVDVGLQRFDEERSESYFRALLERVRAIPGVEGASLTSSPFAESAMGVGFVEVEGAGPREDQEVELGWIERSYFEVLGAPLVAGTGLDAAGSDHQAVINETMARTLWPEQSAVGKRFRFSQDEDAAWLEVVGVVGDTRHFGLAEEETLFASFDLERNWDDSLDRPVTLIVSSTLPASRLAGPVRRAFVETDPKVPISKLETIGDRVAAYATPQRLGSLLLGGFALAALLLAALGIYGVVASDVARRRREIGVRLALGAGRRSVLVLLMSESLAPTLVGLAAGLAMAWTGSRFVEAFLFGVEPLDVAVWSMVPALLLAVGLVSSLLPARRAMRVDPAVTLRSE